MTPDDGLQRASFPQGKVVFGAAARAGQVDVLTFTGSVILGSLLEVRVLDHAELFEHGQRSVDGGDVDGGHAPLDSAGHGLWSDVTFRSHHDAEDCFPLGGQPASIPAEPPHDLVDALHQCSTYCNRFAPAKDHLVCEAQPR
jgi:hypothetical protein